MLFCEKTWISCYVWYMMINAIMQKRLYFDSKVGRGKHAKTILTNAKQIHAWTVECVWTLLETIFAVAHLVNSIFIKIKVVGYPLYKTFFQDSKAKIAKSFWNHVKLTLAKMTHFVLSTKTLMNVIAYRTFTAIVVNTNTTIVYYPPYQSKKWNVILLSKLTCALIHFCVFDKVF